MIFGCFGQDIKAIAGGPGRASSSSDEAGLQKKNIWQDDNFAVSLGASGARSHDAGHVLFRHPETGAVLALYGNIFNARGIAKQFGRNLNGKLKDDLGAILLAAYEKEGDALFKRLNGNFVIVIYEPQKNSVRLVRDHLGIEPLFYYRRGDLLCFCSDLSRLAHAPGVETALNNTAVFRYFLFNYNPGFDTFFQNIHKLRPGNVLKIEAGKMQIDSYWYISFKDSFSKSIDQYREELLELFRDAIRIRLDAERFKTGAYLSGGMDSSTVVGLMRPLLDGPLHTFSFRCRGKSFDESAYARLMSERYATSHHEVPYEAEDVQRIVDVVNASHEPFSDIGIEVASYLLAEKASGVVDYVLTGDGGDELFGGHPVYLADKMADRFGAIPAFLRQPLTKLLLKLPDTDQKKSLVVKAKRFAYSAAFPASLYSNRWRIYYTAGELGKLLHPDWYDAGAAKSALEDIRSLYDEADGGDFLSKTLYGDYFTVVSFYLARMELVRRFGLEGRFPLLDYRLVEYTARIPSNLKIDASGATKHIFHKVMAGALPDEIVFRKDKLGHSVPFKNWLRRSESVQSLLNEILSESALKKRHLFDPAFVRELQDRHMHKADNNSHRLWALLVFELWCRKNLDEAPAKNPALAGAA